MSSNPNNAVGTNAAYAGRTSVNAFNDSLAAYSRGIISGWECSPSSGLTIALGGDGDTRDVAVAEDNSGNKTSIDNISGSPISLTLGAAPGANSRIDAIVAYVDNPPQGSATIVDNYEACGLIAVSGATSASPVAPGDSAIRSAITADGASGTTAYYVVLAYVTMAAGTTDVDVTMIAGGAYAKLNFDQLDISSLSTVLWTNPNPTSNFAAQTVTLSDDLSNYSHIEVIAIDNPTGTSASAYTSVNIPLGNKYTLRAMAAGVPMWRVVNDNSVSSGTSLHFGTATWYSSYNSTNTNTSSQYLVPQKIIGYKW